MKSKEPHFVVRHNGKFLDTVSVDVKTASATAFTEEELDKFFARPSTKKRLKREECEILKVASWTKSGKPRSYVNPPAPIPLEEVVPKTQAQWDMIDDPEMGDRGN